MYVAYKYTRAQGYIYSTELSTPICVVAIPYFEGFLHQFCHALQKHKSGAHGRSRKMQSGSQEYTHKLIGIYIHVYRMHAMINVRRHYTDRYSWGEDIGQHYSSRTVQ